MELVISTIEKRICGYNFFSKHSPSLPDDFDRMLILAIEKLLIMGSSRIDQRYNGDIRSRIRAPLHLCRIELPLNAVAITHDPYKLPALFLRLHFCHCVLTSGSLNITEDLTILNKNSNR